MFIARKLQKLGLQIFKIKWLNEYLVWHCEVDDFLHLHFLKKKNIIIVIFRRYFVPYIGGKCLVDILFVYLMNKTEHTLTLTHTTYDVRLTFNFSLACVYSMFICMTSGIEFAFLAVGYECVCERESPLRAAELQ